MTMTTNKTRFLIVGGVAGGATAAARIRRLTEDAEIVLFEKGKYISYANCGLPYYIGGVIEERDKLFVQTPEAFGKRFNIDVRVENEVVAIDASKKQIRVRATDGSDCVEPYDKLLLSPGASPVVPPLKGIESEGIFTLRNVSDTDRIKSYMSTHNVRRAVIVGGGFIGLEMAENLSHAGAEVAVVEMAPQVMGPIDYSMAALVHEHLLQHNVRLYLEQAVESFSREGDELTVHFKSGISLHADMVLLSIGVKAETRLAQEAGLEIGEMRGIRVNEYLQTSDEHIYAVGDAIEFPHPITGKPWLNFLAGPANRQARIVADNMVLGNKVKYEGSIGTSIAKVFDITVASTGLPAKRLKQMDIPYLSATIHNGAHAGYYPGSRQMDIKITFSPADGRLYGAQIVGYDGVDTRIDQFALAIKQGATVEQLTRLEHAYAPPFSSAKDGGNDALHHFVEIEVEIEVFDIHARTHDFGNGCAAKGENAFEELFLVGSLHIGNLKGLREVFLRNFIAMRRNDAIHYPGALHEQSRQRREQAEEEIDAGSGKQGKLPAVVGRIEFRQNLAEK